MSAYTTRLCLEHGEWDDDVDNPSDCPDCIKEGKTEVQRLNAEIAALREAVRHLHWVADKPAVYPMRFCEAVRRALGETP